MLHEWWRREGFWWGNLKERDNLKDISVDRRKILKYL
jgi:hypothetical protein